MADLEVATIGINIDPLRKSVVTEFGVTCKAGGPFSSQLPAMAEVRTHHAGFDLPNSAGKFNITLKYNKDETDHSLAQLKLGRHLALSSMSKGRQNELTAALKKAATEMFDLVAKTIARGELDGGGTVTFDPQVLAFVMGADIADGMKVQKIVSDLAEMAKSEPAALKVKLDAAKHGGFTFNTVQIPIAPGAKLQPIFGAGFECVVATGDKAVYVASGKDPQALLKRVIDGSAAKPNQKVLPLEISASLAPIIRFFATAEQFNPALNALLPKMENLKNDRVRLEVLVEKMDLRYRVVLEEDALKIIGGLVRPVQAGARPPRIEGDL